MKKKIKRTMVTPSSSITSRIFNRLLLLVTFLFVSLSGYGQTLSIENVTEDEDEGSMVFIVTLNGTVFPGTSVTYSFVDGTATGGVDYDNTIGVLNFDGFDTETEEITVPITDDLIDEGINEAFTVQLGTPTNGVLLAGGGSAIGTIT
ncbi:Calx-beta domain-containing protein, partial [Maribacter sp. TH_r10]|uniref:Calx-beta domain-containing protein n=1 Tax=Maribacter sp. TH_r10 TaxID=3082086 RepID=UPI002954EDC7